MIKFILINPILMSYENYLQLFTLYQFSFWSSQEELEPWRKKKPIPQVEDKNRTLSCCIYNSRNFSQKNYTNCSWNATISRVQKDWFWERNFLFKIDNLEWQTKSMCEFQDWYRKPQNCRVPLPKQFVPQRLWNWPDVDAKPVTLAKQFYLLS